MSLQEDRLEDIITLALTTDGAHHKQWYLEQVLLRVAGKSRFDVYKEAFGWEDGVIP